MICKVQSCKNYDKNLKDNDCILELLDFIRLHYFHVQTELNQKSGSILTLETANLSLNKTVDGLMQQIQLIDTIDTSPMKRKKTKTSNDTPDSTILSTSKVFPRAQLNLNTEEFHETSEDLNMALNSDVIFDDSCDVFVSPMKSNNILKSPKKEKSPSPRIPLSPANRKEDKQKNTPVKNKDKVQKIKNKGGTPVKLTPTKMTQYLPKRIIDRTPVTKQKANENNAGTLIGTSSGWLSSEKKNKSNNLGFIQPVKFDRQDSLDNSSEAIACSQKVMQKSQRKDRNMLTLRGTNHAKMRQSKLEFDRQKVSKESNKISHTVVADDSKADDTFCDEIVCPSPGVSSAKERHFSTQKSLRKLTRKNSDDELFNISIKKSAASSAPEQTTSIQTSTPAFGNERMKQIKDEQQTAKKTYVTNLFPSSGGILKKDVNEPLIGEDSIDDLSLDLGPPILKNCKQQGEKVKINNDTCKSDSSSVYILPSQPDDVIVVEETENNYFDNIDSMELMNEIMKIDSSQTQPVLKTYDQKLIKQFKKVLNPTNQNQFKQPQVTCKPNKELANSNFGNSSDTDITQLNTLDNEKILKKENLQKKINSDENLKIKNPITLQSVGHNCDCRDCNAYLRNLISLDLTKEEIRWRLKHNTKHADHPLKLHNTPEGFWNPLMTDFSPGDPRNEVLIDTIFLDKKKDHNDKKRPKI